MSSETALRGTSVVSRLRRIAGEVAEFANAEAAGSGRPGHVNGPQDAYRRLVGVGELARRIGAVPAWVLAGYNEQVSRRAMLRSERLGRPVPPANTRESRAMDRRNNRLAAGIGMTARSPEDVVQRARRAVERAQSIYSGSGADGSAFWHPRSMWAGDAEVIPWSVSPPTWLAVESDHLRHYQARTLPGPSGNSGGSTFVDPHLRGGHPVAGHSRSLPGG
jgi:hypothetical protein